MRVLVTTPAGLGHIHPAVPLARAVADRGHDLLWAAPRRSIEHVRAAGFDAVATSDAPPFGPREVTTAFPELADLPIRDRPDFMFAKLFGALTAPPMLEGLTPVAEQWRPDLVVADAGEFAGPIVAAKLGVPCVAKGFGPLLPEPRVARITDEVAPLWRAHGMEPRPYGGMYDHLYLDPFPPSLPSPPAEHIRRRQLLRPIAYDGTSDGPLPLPTHHVDRPLVYVTMGTVFNDARPLRDAVAALAGRDVRVLVTVGPVADPDVLGPQPAHVRVERYVPQTRLLPECDVVVSHSGSGTVLATLALGTPQLCLPQGADQFLNAEAVSASSAGISLPPDAATPDSIGNAVQELLDQPSYRAAAATVAADIDAMPSPADVCEVLEALV